MNDSTLYGLMEVARDEANRHIAAGVPKDRAIRIAAHALCDLVNERDSGLGQVGPAAALTQAAEAAPVKAIREAVSPWLWVVSLFGFGLALLNTQRISKIYGGWRAGKKAVKEGRVPV